MTLHILFSSIILLLSLFMIFHMLRRKFTQVLRYNYSGYQHNVETNELSLLNINPTSVRKTLSLHRVTRSEIVLNDAIILSIDHKLKKELSLDEIEKLSQIFQYEYQHKMVENKIRKVQLVVTVDDKKKYSICLYYRKGNRRYTDKPFELVLQDLIDWCVIMPVI